MLQRTYDLDVVPGGVPLNIHLSQYDSDVTLIFRLYSSEGVLDVPASGVTAMIKGTKLDGNGISADADYALTGGVPTVTVRVTKQMTAVAGKNTFEIVLSAVSGSYTYTLPSANFYLVVERAALDTDTIISNSEIRELQDIIDHSDELIAAAEISQQAQDNLAALTTRAETAATNASASETAAASSASDALGYKNAAESAVNGFSNTVSSATSSAISDINSAGTARIAAVEAAAEAAAQDALDAVDGIEDDITTAKNAAIADLNSAAQSLTEDFEETVSDADAAITQKAQAVVDIQTAADTNAALALQQANNAANEAASVQATVDGILAQIASVNAALAGKVDGAYADPEGYLYLTSNNEVVVGPIGPFAGGTGGGGGGSTNSAQITLTNTTGWMSQTLASGSACVLSFNWSSIENETPTGNGTMTVTVNGAVRLLLDVAQGNISADVSPFLSTGTNAVRVSVTDTYGNMRNVNFSIIIVEISLSSSFDDSVAYTGPVTFPYTPVGAVSKTVHFSLDGTELETVTTSVSGRQQTYILSQQTHGAHVLECWFTATINGTEVSSNVLHYEIIWLETLSTAPIIASSYSAATVTQYSTIAIPYTVYTPTSQMSEVTISVDGTAVSTVTVDRTRQSFSYRFDVSGQHTVTITSGTATKTITFTVTAANINATAETESLSLYLSSYGRYNSAADKAEWGYGNIGATLTGFNFSSNGWVADPDGVTVLRINGGARVSVPYYIFAEDFRTTGKTIEVEFATRDVLNYDSVILSCMSGDRGIQLTAQGCVLKSEQTSVSMQFKEDEHVRVGFVIEKRTEHRLIYCYINGVMSGVVQYPDGDDFSQMDPVGITIGSDGCTTDIYCIRVYDNDLNRSQMLDNWIADTQDGGEMLSRYSRNNVYDEYGNIVIAKLPSDLPYLIIECAELPQYKGDKKTVSGSYTDPIHPAKSFTFTGCEANVQGTSSQYYERKNYTLKFKGGFTGPNNVTVSTYKMTDTSVPTKEFCMKADVASSEGANNVELARLYNEACVYRTPAQVADNNVRQGIDGHPIVIFWRNTTDNSVMFLGKYNFNDSKGSEEVFGFEEGDESWEVLNNTSDRVLFKSADFSSDDWLNDFEARYPDTDPAYTDYAQLKEFADWIVSTDTTAATGDALGESVTYDGVTYTADTAAYRLAKFRAEAGDYMEINSALFYYLFTEIFLMVDSRAKNMFPSFMGTSLVVEEPEEEETE